MRGTKGELGFQQAPGWYGMVLNYKEENRRKKIFIFQEVVRLLLGTDILPLFHQLNFSLYLQSPKLVTTS